MFSLVPRRVLTFFSKSPPTPSVVYGTGGAVGLLVLAAILTYICHKKTSENRIDSLSEKKITIDQVKSWNRTGAVDKLRSGYMDACRQEDAAWQCENLVISLVPDK
eukprot:sb/3477825/